MTTDETVYFLETDIELENAHSVAACGGDTTPPNLMSIVDLQFITFACVDGGLYDLDGRKQQHIYHGPPSQETRLKDSVEVIEEKFVARNPQSKRFNLMVLAY